MIRVGAAEISPDHYIGGERCSSSKTIEVFSPIQQQLLGTVAEASDEHVDAAVATAQDAFPSWSALGAAGRLPYLQRFAEEIGKRKELFSVVESTDAGVLMSRMQHGVVARAMKNIAWFAERAMALQSKEMESAQAKHLILHDPAGVCAIITPWNAPLMLATWKVGPALASGNTVVIKPPEWAPLTSSLLADAAHAAGVPPGVLNLVQGTGSQAGARLVADERISRVSFTGSVETATKVAQSAAKNIVPCSLELGGKSPFIVLEDADLEAAAATGALMYRNATQVCLAGTRFLVHRSVAEEFVFRMRAYVEKLVIGDPRHSETEVGPIIHPSQFKKVCGYVERAVRSGAEVLWGGAAHDFGALYYQPTMLRKVQQSDEIVQEEVFGPVLVLQEFEDDDEVVSMANGVGYGLGGVCYGATNHAIQLARRVRTGFIWVNSFGIRDLEAPFGGCKRSGIGREGGDWSFEFFCDIKDIIVPKQTFKASFSQR